KTLVGLTIWVLSLLSLWWLTRRSRRILRKSLGRELRPGEDSSLGAWLKLSSEQLESARTELSRDPFGKMSERIFGKPPEPERTEEITRIRMVDDDARTPG